jgi:hypothetical protein
MKRRQIFQITLSLPPTAPCKLAQKLLETPKFYLLMLKEKQIVLMTK